MKIVSYCLLGALLAGCTGYSEEYLLSGKALRSSSYSLVASGSEAFLKNSAKAPHAKLIGSTLDLQDRKVLQRSSPRTIDRMDRGDPLTINDVIKLSQGGVDDDSVINYMKDTGSSYHLSQSQVRRLQDAGVSQRIINFMLDSGR